MGFENFWERKVKCQSQSIDYDLSLTSCEIKEEKGEIT